MNLTARQNSAAARARRFSRGIMHADPLDDLLDRGHTREPGRGAVDATGETPRIGRTREQIDPVGEDRRRPRELH
jgi:hypothetical protein